MKMRASFALAVALLTAPAALPAQAQTVRVAWQPTMLAVTVNGRQYRLAALLLYPQDGAKHPLVVISHGSPRIAQDRATMLPAASAAEMQWFVERGYTAAAVMRRGYGQSQGPWAEGYGSCQKADYADAGLQSAADIAASIRVLAQNPHVDGSHVLAVGVSAGAFATVALTADPPPGLRGAIVFAPGRGSLSADQVCDPDALVAAFAQYGRSSRVPMLWISAANDHFFGPQIVRRTLAAFDGAGGKATFFAAPPYGTDGHSLFGGAGGIAIWQPPVTAFLTQHALASAPAVLVGPAVPAPAELGPKGRAAFAQYLLAPPNKAFAMTPAGRYAYAYGAGTDAGASARALQACGQPACEVVNRDDAPAK